jgi:hypothetical protein
MATNIVTSTEIVKYFKTCKYFRQNLGIVQSVDKSGTRMINDQDKFSYFYYNQYRAQIFAQGNVGDVKFYIDYGIRDTTVAVYFSDMFDEHILNFDFENYKKNGIEFYIGHILKNVEEKHEERKKKQEIKKHVDKQLGDPDAVFNNPGAVTYADLKAYLEKQQKERFQKNN